jgi:ComF family protein
MLQPLTWIAPFLDLLYPRVCAGCGALVDLPSGELCWDCLAAFERVREPFCAHCGDPVEGLVEHRYVCSVCANRPPAFDLARSALRYRGALRAALHAFKYGGAACLARDFTAFLVGCVRAQYADARLDGVLFVPLYPRRERARTYNQSRLLAASLARALRLPLLDHSLVRRRDTSSQTRLTAQQRRENMHDAFAVPEPEWIDGRRVLLVDDVMTTGATVNECSRVLKRAGAVSVHVVTVGRG